MSMTFHIHRVRDLKLDFRYLGSSVQAWVLSANSMTGDNENTQQEVTWFTRDPLLAGRLRSAVHAFNKVMSTTALESTNGRCDTASDPTANRQDEALSTVQSAVPLDGSTSPPV